MSDEEAREHEPHQARQYLSVPYTQRDQVKAAGALWDWQEKLWYIGPEGTREKLARWLPENAHEQAVAPSDPREEFAAVLRDLGANLTGPHPMMDGKSHRVTTLDDKRGEKSMFYVGHLDGRPAGYVKNNRTGEEQRWKASARSMTKEQFDAIAAPQRQEREADRQALYAKTAQRIQYELDNYKVADPEHEYLRSKRVSAFAGLLQSPHGSLAVPAYDAEGQLWSVQYINLDRTKRFARDSRKEGCFHILGGTMADLNDPDAVVIAEGYATAASLKELYEQLPSHRRVEFVAAFDAGNVPHVARALRDRYPHLPMVIAADNDLSHEHGNPGMEKGREAAIAANASLLIPSEELLRTCGGSDWNDVATALATELDMLQSHITAPLALALEAAQARLQHVDSDSLTVTDSTPKEPDAEVLIQHGKAPYAFNPENQESYFVRTIDHAGQEKLYWGQDLPRALSESGAGAGDTINASKQRVAGTRGNGWKIATVDRDPDRLIKEYDRLVTTTPGGRAGLEHSNPELVAARDAIVVQEKKEQLTKELQTQPLALHHGQRLKI
jgi:phage/plasmid primase-like uncharacterized protein